MTHLDLSHRWPAAGKVLVVDDQPLARAVLRLMLEADGFDVEECSGASEVMQRIASSRYDAVLLDVMMPDIDGIELCHRIRASGDLVTPVLLVTALSDRASRTRGKEAGADDFLTKPVDRVELLVRIRCLQRVRAWYDQVAGERERLQEEVDRAHAAIVSIERRAYLGTLAAGLGHDLKNLSAITWGIRTGLEDGGPAQHEDLEALGDLAGRLDTLGRQLMRLAHEGPGRPERTPLRERVQAALDLLRRAGRTTGVAVILVVDHNPWVRVDPSELDQILLNLLGNALDAVAQGAVREIAIRVGLRDGRARCEIRDSGPGLSDEVLARAFEPYFSTKGADQGHGLGLSVSRRVLDQWGGTIGLQRRTDAAGALVWFELPIAATADP